MSHYNGVVNSFLDLRTAIFNACVANGWTLNGDILTKSSSAVQIKYNASSTAAMGLGLVFQGGSGFSSGALVGPSPITPRLGPPAQVANQPIWPMEYDIHIFNDPDEVFIVARFDVDRYFWAAFGVSTISLPNNGLWLSAISRCGGGPSSSSPGITIDATNGGNVNAISSSAGAIFWNTRASNTSANYNSDTINVGIDGTAWAGSASASNVNGFNAIIGVAPRMARQPNNWNSEGILMRIQGLFIRASNKLSIVCDLVNARYVRIDNYAPGQIVTLGADRWRIYPFHRKNNASRDGGNNVDHTGTFGWAIRYDGP